MTKPHVFSDTHHAGLYASLHYLLENRLGFELYRPIGIDWFTEGYWKIAEPYNNNPATVKQYLEIRSTAEDGTVPLNEVEHTTQEGIYHTWDYNNEYYQKAITLDKFKSMDFDFIIASIPAHIDAYKKLIKDTGSKAKLIYQMGNIGWHENIPWDKIDNVMASVKEFPVPTGKNVVFYRQEFDTELFNQTDSRDSFTISSFVNCLPNPELFLQLEGLLPEYSFKSFGITCRDGIKHSVREIAKEMASASWGYHFKPYGDGFGHIIHNWMCAGKPILVNLDDYKDKLAGELLEDMVTCVDISHRDVVKTAGIVRELQEKGYEDMRKNIYKRFSEVVDYKKDAENVRAFLGSAK